MACLEFSDIVKLSVPQVEALNIVARENPDPNVPAACHAFSRQVTLVEGVIVTIYTMAVGLTRRSDALEEIASIWQQTGNLCDLALKILLDLKDRYPYCGTPELYNRLLDYKLACNERREHAREEISCLRTPVPEGLFPALS